MIDESVQEQPRRYEVRLTEPAQEDINAERERLAGLVSEEYANRWQDGPIAEMERLALFPSIHEVAPESELHDIEIRRLLYYGPSRRRRRGGAIYRVLFYVAEPTEARTSGTVHVLHIWHGARRPET